MKRAQAAPAAASGSVDLPLVRTAAGPGHRHTGLGRRLPRHTSFVDSEEPEYARLAEFRRELRAFLRWSERAAQETGLTSMQHQLLLAIRGRGGAPTVGEIADDLMLRHHSAGELINRAEAAGLVARTQDAGDRRQTRVTVTGAGNRTLRQLSEQHLDEIRRLAPIVASLTQS
jgi:DNA-binding MarR family transcriptional regulator